MQMGCIPKHYARSSVVTLNPCPCCQYEVHHVHPYCISTDLFKLVEEPQLKYCKISIIDGNTSLWQVDWHESASKQTFQSDYFLPADEVNEIEMTGASCQVCFGLAPSLWPLLMPNMEGNYFDEAAKDGNVEQCVCNWQAALPNNLKSMFSKFDKTSIFVAVCWHGLFWPVSIWFGVVHCESSFLISALTSFTPAGPNIPLYFFVFSWSNW